ASGNAISISDVDAGSSSVQVTLAVTNGVLNLAGTSGLTVSGNGTGTVVVTGSLTNINTALNGLTFQPNANYNGSANLTVTTNDQGNTGSGGALSDTDTVAITVNPVNDAPVNSVPAAQTMNEDGTLTFSSAGGNAISISDVDAGSANVQVTVGESDGEVKLAGTTGRTVSGNGTGTVVVTGAITKINTALNGLDFHPNANYNGSANLTVTTNDQGNTGSGGALSDTDTVAITVNAVNDAPVNSVPAAQTMNEDGTLTFSSATGNAISISDVDAGSSNVQVTLAATNGVLNIAGTTGLTVSGNGTGTVVVTASITITNTALNGLAFHPNANYNGSANLTVTTNDHRHTRPGFPPRRSSALAITVNAVNDAPVNAVPAAQTMNEDGTLTFSSAT